MKKKVEKVSGESAPKDAKEKAFSSINTKSFVIVVIMLAVIIAVSGALSYFIPQGSFQRGEDGALIPDTYEKGEVKGIAVWRIITAPFRVFASGDALTIIMISLFLLIMSGVFNIMDKTGGVAVFISKIVNKCGSRKKLIIFAAVFVFMAFGSFFGMLEELVTLLPLIIVFMLSLGFDTMTGVGVCMLAACFGFSAAITNPFSVGLAAQFAGISVLDGMWLRVVFFACIYAIVCAYLLIYVRRIEKNPMKSLSYNIDEEKRTAIAQSVTTVSNDEKTNNRIFKIFAIFFGVQAAILVLIASIRAISDYAIPILSVSFLVGGGICGGLVEKPKQAFKHFLQGALSMAPAVLLIAMASSVKLILAESNIIDTVMNFAINCLKGNSKFVMVLMFYALILFLQIFIGSASAKIFLVMPIVLPIAQALGISPELVILTYCIADGFTDMILPTNPVLLIGLSMANISYAKWVKWTWLLQLIVLAFTILVLFIASAIGY